MIFYISPYDSSPMKNIGGTINLAIESLVASDEDWIVHVDQDVMFLLPDSKKQIEEILSLNQFNKDIFGVRTNRLGSKLQVIEAMFDDPNILNHIDAATTLHRRFYGLVRSVNGPVAAMVMCFKVKTWKMVGRFNENVLNFDLLFCLRAQKMGLKIGVMTGVYVFHLYRMGMEGLAQNNYTHLLPEN